MLNHISNVIVDASYFQQDALIAIKGGRIPPPSRLPSFEEVREIIGFNDYYEEEKHYTIKEDSSPALQRG